VAPEYILNQGPGLSDSLVPIGDARQLTLCSYSVAQRTQSPGSAGSRSAPQKFIVTKRSVVQAWRKAFNALPTSAPGQANCPPGGRSVLLAAFVGAHDFTTLRISTAACGAVTNGAAARALKPSAVRLIEAVIPGFGAGRRLHRHPTPTASN
jgi:hypothetical protein